MRQKMHDCIAISTQVGHPDIFLTMTCNPKWPEMQRNLYPVQRADDRPELVARVFNLKLRHMLKIVIEEQVFWKGCRVGPGRRISEEGDSACPTVYSFWMNSRN